MRATSRGRNNILRTQDEPMSYVPMTLSDALDVCMAATDRIYENEPPEERMMARMEMALWFLRAAKRATPWWAGGML